MSVNKIIIAAKASVSGLGFIMDLYERHTAGCTKIRPRRFCLGYSVADIDKQSKLLCDMKGQQSTSPTPITHTHRHVSLFAQHITFSTLWVLSELSDDSLLDVSAYYKKLNTTNEC